MPVTERTAATEALMQAYVEQALREAEGSTLSSIINDILPLDDSDSSLDLDAMSTSDSNSSSDLELGDANIDDLELELTGPYLPPPSQILAEALALLHSSRYLNERIPIAKSGIQLSLTLNEWCHSRPEIFRDHVRVDPHTFDALVAAIKDDPVFHNNSNNSQLPVREQAAVALYRLGHYGNAVTIQDVALWAGWGVGTVDLVTRRFFVAICRPTFFQAAVSWPSDEDQEKARQWVESQTCARWRDGWLMVDGTLVVLDRRPGHYGNAYFDRKSNYSLNVQVSS